MYRIFKPGAESGYLTVGKAVALINCYLKTETPGENRRDRQRQEGDRSVGVR